MNELVRFSSRPELKSPSLVVGWTLDASQLGARVTEYLIRKLGGQPFCEIEPVEFFTLGGVTIENDLVQFPETKFYACPDSDMVVLRSAPPSYEWYRFLNLILDIAQKDCHVREIYTVGGMVALGAHTVERRLTGTPNSPEFKKLLNPYGITTELNYESPSGQKPTLNSFTSWTAKLRNIPAANLWVPIPFYLLTVEDPRAEKKLLEFLNDRLDLHIDLDDIDEEIRKQDEKMGQLRANFPEIDNCISKLERNMRLTEKENEQLVKQVEEFLRETGD
jgi:proteasome assembly chaperone (PAC2) family protein